MRRFRFLILLYLFFIPLHAESKFIYEFKAKKPNHFHYIEDYLKLDSEILSNKFLNIYIDSDRSNHYESALAIERGIKLAFEEHGNKLQDYYINFIVLDHGANTARVERHLQNFIEDEHALLYFAGLHSPPLLKLQNTINDNHILTLVPWAAASGLTRTTSPENYIFRLSIDDKLAGTMISAFAYNDLTCKKPHLLLEDTRWGDSNLESMLPFYLNKGIKPRITRFDWNTGKATAKKIIAEILNSDDDCIQMVAGVPEGKLFAKYLIEYSETKKIPLISHWGIIGGDFHKFINAEMRKKIDLYFIQTCFSFINDKQSDLAKSVLERLKAKYSDINSAVESVK
ncbi:MAG: ABC transporter substrate-binding protein [Candidatus Caenarcaniphilales bacterium]|nr:ABC transporter substrate-binding protein [Candidatus Caenarcaniphilales bacterium]